MVSTIKAIVIHEKDTVATALVPLHSGDEVSLVVRNRVEQVLLRSEIPVGHKFALKDMEKGVPVIKYGEPIGLSMAKIVKGEHVHVHNVESGTKREMQR